MKTNDGPIGDTVVYASLPSDSQETIPLILGEDTPMETKQRFITRVYGVLWTQLAVTSGWIALCNQIQSIQTFLVSDKGVAMMWFSVVCIFALTCTMYCARECLRTCPGGCMYLTAFTILMSYLLGYVGVVYSPIVLLLSGITTLFLFSGLTLYAIQTRYDYTESGNYLLCMLLGLICMSFIMTFVTISWLMTLYSCLGATIFSLYIVYDTQLIVGGEHRSLQFRQDDIVLAATSLYLDVINLFLFVVDLMSGGTPGNR